MDQEENRQPDSAASIKALWEGRALDPLFDEDLVTHRDRNQRVLEIELALQDLPRGGRIIDIGCGNGFSTGIFASHAAAVLGVDYSPAMIERAKRKLGDVANIRFEVQDVLDLKVPPASFDVAISQRCLINLTSWDAQQQALANIAKTLRPGGTFVLQEGSRQGRARLNEVREKVGLARMPPVAFNLDFDEDKLWPFVQRFFDIAKVRRLGLYDLISRVVHPLLIGAQEPQYDAPINQVAARVGAMLEGADDVAREFSAVLVRRSDPAPAHGNDRR